MLIKKIGIIFDSTSLILKEVAADLFLLFVEKK